MEEVILVVRTYLAFRAVTVRAILLGSKGVIETCDTLLIHFDSGGDSDPDIFFL